VYRQRTESILIVHKTHRHRVEGELFLAAQRMLDDDDGVILVDIKRCAEGDRRSINSRFPV
jgi:hypothetical protein